MEMFDYKESDLVPQVRKVLTVGDFFEISDGFALTNINLDVLADVLSKLFLVTDPKGFQKLLVELR